MRKLWSDASDRLTKWFNADYELRNYMQMIKIWSDNANNEIRKYMYSSAKIWSDISDNANYEPG